MPVEQLLEQLLTIVEREGASDLHLLAGRQPLIRSRTELLPLANMQPITDEETKGLLKSMVSERQFASFLETLELDFSYRFREGLRFRGNAYIQDGQVAIAMRSIGQVRPFDELNLPPILKDFAMKKQGFFLVVGPVGQGKSTTLAAMVDHINQTRRENIVTIEHPIEYIFQDKNSVISQRSVGVDTHSFEDALHSIFRQDVNVIMVGEMRSLETIGTAVTAAETGHLVLSTLHTNNAAQTVDRIIDSFPASQQDQIRTQLAGSLLGIFSQRLVPTVSGSLMPAYEILIKNNAVANLIREKRTHEIDTVIETGHDEGMISMNQSLMGLVRAGHITVETAKRYSLNPKGFERMVG